MTNSHELTQLSNQMADAVERVGAALVTVNGRVRQSATGIVFAPHLVVTADHVLERDDDLTVETSDGRSLSAQLLGRDANTDLAVLRVDDLGHDPAAQAQSQARVGQLILAVGRPSAAGPMASLGIVSAVGGPLRTRRGSVIEQVIQTDATPYPGFSGGALVDGSGAVQALLTTGIIGGVALGIPAATVWQIAATLSQHGNLKRGFLGISSQPVNLPEGQRGGGTQEHGLLLVRVEPDSPASKAGLLIGDILVALDGQSVQSTEDLQALLNGERVGKSVPVSIIRGGSSQTLNVTVGERT